MADDYWAGQGEFPGAVYGVVGGLLAAARADRLAIAPQPRARMRTATGGWLTLHATWLTGPGDGRERQIAVVLKASPPVQVWPWSARHTSSHRGGAT